MTKTVYQLIAEVSGELSSSGISKDRNNQQQGYKFRGIDDVYNTLAPFLAKAGLVIIPRVLSHDQVERQSNKGFPLFYTTVRVEFDFVSSHDGSKHTAAMYGEAMDSADKSTNKAMSAAYKYVCMQVFCIPTEGDNDADATTHEVAPKKAKEPPKQAVTPEMVEIYERLSKAMSEAKTVKDLDAISKLQKADIEKLDKEGKERLRSIYTARKVQIEVSDVGA